MLKLDAVHRAHGVVAGPKATEQVVDLEQGRAPCAAHAGTLRGSKASRTASPMKISSDSISASTTKAGEGEPRRVEVVLALLQQLAERRRARRHAEAEEVERRQRR